MAVLLEVLWCAAPQVGNPVTVGHNETAEGTDHTHNTTQKNPCWMRSHRSDKVSVGVVFCCLSFLSKEPLESVLLKWIAQDFINEFIEAWMFLANTVFCCISWNITFKTSCRSSVWQWASYGLHCQTGSLRSSSLCTRPLLPYTYSYIRLGKLDDFYCTASIPFNECIYGQDVQHSL